MEDSQRERVRAAVLEVLEQKTPKRFVRIGLRRAAVVGLAAAVVVVGLGVWLRIQGPEVVRETAESVSGESENSDTPADIRDPVGSSRQGQVASKAAPIPGRLPTGAEVVLSSRKQGIAALRAEVGKAVDFAQQLGAQLQAERSAARALPVSRCVLTVHRDAEFRRLGTPSDEVVRVTSGQVALEVAPLSPGERLRVVTGDAEVEVRGTAFSVTVEKDRLLTLAVSHGLVELRRVGHPAMLLSSGERWVAVPEEVAAPPTARADDGLRERHASRRGTIGARGGRERNQRDVRVAGERDQRTRLRAEGESSPQTRGPANADEKTLIEGWDALQANDYGRAAEAFGRVRSAGGSLSEDATFWRAVALARAGRDREARKEFEIFVEQYGQSSRAGEARAMLGWMKFEAGDLDGADSLFLAARDDQSAEVRASARMGIEAVRQARGQNSDDRR